MASRLYDFKLINFSFLYNNSLLALRFCIYLALPLMGNASTNASRVLYSLANPCARLGPIPSTPYILSLLSPERILVKINSNPAYAGVKLIININP